jgi:hypothetical protein
MTKGSQSYTDRRYQESPFFMRNAHSHLEDSTRVPDVGFPESAYVSLGVELQRQEQPLFRLDKCSASVRICSKTMNQAKHDLRNQLNSATQYEESSMFRRSVCLSTPTLNSSLGDMESDKHRMVEHDLLQAARIQQALLPRPSSTFPGYEIGIVKLRQNRGV